MSVRRTREEKIRIQQRREEEKFVWKEESPVVAKSSSPTPVKKELLDPRLQQERQWLKKDLLQTLIALFLVIILLGYFFWRSLQ